MKTTLLALLILSGLLVDCTSNDPKPVAQIWSQGCAELFPEQNTYRLSGPCCSDVVFPRLDLMSGQTFSVEATQYTYGSSGARTLKTAVHGQVSRDGATLTLTYESTYGLASLTLKPGHATVVCDCFCP